MLSFISMVAIFSIPGFSMSAQISAAKEKHGNLKLLFRKKIYWSFISTIVLATIGLYYQIFKNDMQIAYMVYIASFIYPLYNLRSIWESWLTAIGEYKKLSLIQIWFSLVGLISLSISLVLIGNIYLVIIITFTAIAISNILIIKYFQNRTLNDIEDDDLISYGYQLSWAMIIPVILSFDKLIISEYLSMEDVAIYSVAMIFPLYIKTLYSIINRLITPHITSAKSIQEAWKYLKPKLIKISILFFFMGVIGFYSIEYAINIIYTSKYQESGLYAKWLWLVLAFAVPATYLANILRAQQILKFSYYFEAFNSIGKVGLFLILIPAYELWGAVYGILFINILSSIFFISYFKYELKKLEFA
jgi:O-antigen/teichoic acid export membrane protein